MERAVKKTKWGAIHEIVERIPIDLATTVFAAELRSNWPPTGPTVPILQGPIAVLVQIINFFWVFGFTA